MSGEYALARRHFEALLEEGSASGMSPDVMGRALFHEIVQSWLEDRLWTDVADELRFAADNLDPDTDFEFIRP